jgi:hypothetical protein
MLFRRLAALFTLSIVLFASGCCCCDRCCGDRCCGDRCCGDRCCFFRRPWFHPCCRPACCESPCCGSGVEGPPLAPVVAPAACGCPR